MAQPQIAGNNVKALRIGQRLMVGAKSFGKGVRNSVDTSQQVITQSARKIKADQKRINAENKKQQRFEEAVREETQRRQKGMFSGGYKLADGSKKLVEKVLINPMAAFWKLVGAWVLMNLPTIIEEVRKFVKKVRIVIAAINNALRATGNLFKGWLSYGQAWLRNMVTFDWGDSTGRLEDAQNEINNSYDELNASWDTIYNVWGKEEKELDDMLAWLDSGKTIKETTDSITQGLPVPQTPAFGGGSQGYQSSGDGGYRGTANTYGVEIPTASDTKWAPVLNLIASVESVGGSYDSIYPSSTKPGLSSMSIAEADAWQASTAGSRGSAAAGRYQFMNIKTQAAAAGIGPNEQFSPKNQDKMAIALIEGKRGVTTEMLANDPREAQMRLAQEWAGLPKDATNKSYYGNDGINKAGTDTQAVKGAFSDVLTGGISTPQVQGSGAGMTTPGNFELTNNVAHSDFSRTAAQGGGGSVGKTSGYGMRGGRMHYGVDIGTGGQTGFGVACNVKGKVTRVSSGPAAGNYVEIVTSDNTMYRFLHLRTAFVKPGEAYNGQVIGEIGSTGRSTGIHLHFEVAPRGGGSVDPTPWLRLLSIGRIRAKTSGSSVSSNSRANAAQLNSAASSNRTNGNKNRTQTVLLNQTTYVK